MRALLFALLIGIAACKAPESSSSDAASAPSTPAVASASDAAPPSVFGSASCVAGKSLSAPGVTEFGKAIDVDGALYISVLNEKNRASVLRTDPALNQIESVWQIENSVALPMLANSPYGLLVVAPTKKNIEVNVRTDKGFAPAKGEAALFTQALAAKLPKGPGAYEEVNIIGDAERVILVSRSNSLDAGVTKDEFLERPGEEKFAPIEASILEKGTPGPTWRALPIRSDLRMGSFELGLSSDKHTLQIPFINPRRRAAFPSGSLSVLSIKVSGEPGTVLDLAPARDEGLAYVGAWALFSDVGGEFSRCSLSPESSLRCTHEPALDGFQGLAAGRGVLIAARTRDGQGEVRRYECQNLR